MKVPTKFPPRTMEIPEWNIVYNRDWWQTGYITLQTRLETFMHEILVNALPEREEEFDQLLDRKVRSYAFYGAHGFRHSVGVHISYPNDKKYQISIRRRNKQVPELLRPSALIFSCVAKGFEDGFRRIVRFNEEDGTIDLDKIAQAFNEVYDCAEVLRENVRKAEERYEQAEQKRKEQELFLSNLHERFGLVDGSEGCPQPEGVHFIRDSSLERIADGPDLDQYKFIVCVGGLTQDELESMALVVTEFYKTMQQRKG